MTAYIRYIYKHLILSLPGVKSDSHNKPVMIKKLSPKKDKMGFDITIRS